MAVTKIRGNTQILAGTITDTEISASANIATSKLADGAEFLKRDGSVALTGALNANSHKITNLTTPTADSDAANKLYVDSVASGLDVKESCRAATTANITLSGAQTIDGVSVIATNRVLVKDQTDASENGLYVAAAGSWSRALDADTDAEVTAGMFTFVEEGTVNGDAGFVLVSDNPLVVGTDDLLFSQFSSTGTIIAGAGLTRTGDTLAVVSANGGIVVNADNIALTVANASLTIAAGGIKIPDATGGQVIVANSGGIPVSQTLSGDVSSVSNTGVVTINASTIVKKADYITREAPTGSINGSNTSFALANTPLAGSESVYLNGILQQPGAGNDYTISGATITYLSAPLTGDKLLVSYLK